MTLYTVTQPDPPAGQDFTFTVPGRYLYDVTGITATLTTGGSFASLHDSSGNGHNGFYTSVLGYPVSVPGLVAGDAATQFAALVGVTPAVSCSIPPTVIDWTGPFTIEFYATLGPGPNQGYLIDVHPVFGGFPEVTVFVDTAGNFQLQRTDGALVDDWLYNLAGITTDGLPHRYMLTYGAGVAVLYVDTNIIAPFAQVVNNPVLSAATSVTFNDNAFGGTGIPMVADELAIYPAALTAGDDAAHAAAAGTSFAAYTAAVLASAPGGYYHLDDGASTGRQPSLVVTNGTTELVAVPSGFPAVATPGPYEYSWQPALNADVQSTDGTLTTVAIPQLLLLAGYTVGVRTLDLVGTDQWSNIALWWDDAYQLQLDPYGNYLFGGGIHLTYHQIGT